MERKKIMKPIQWILTCLTTVHTLPEILRRKAMPPRALIFAGKQQQTLSAAWRTAALPARRVYWKLQEPPSNKSTRPRSTSGCIVRNGIKQCFSPEHLQPKRSLHVHLFCSPRNRQFRRRWCALRLEPKRPRCCWIRSGVHLHTSRGLLFLQHDDRMNASTCTRVIDWRKNSEYLFQNFCRCTIWIKKFGAHWERFTSQGGRGPPRAKYGKLQLVI